MIYIGCDPGKNGGLAILNGEAPQFRCKGGDLRADRGREKRQIANEILKS